LAIGLSNLANIFNLEQIVITGKVAALLEPYLKKVLSPSVGELALYRELDIVFAPGLSDCIWKGAGLLFLDPSYSRLFLHPAHGDHSVADGSASPRLLLQEAGGMR
jgi:hypothetical protein